MDELAIRETLAKNLAYYRKLNNMTQAELAERINYSDKSVSKWERGEGIPDIIVLAIIAQVFGITVNDLIADPDENPAPIQRKTLRLKSRIMIPLMSVGLVFLAAAIVYWVLRLIYPDMPRLWMTFIYAIPVSAIVSMILTKLWWDIWPRLAACSIFIWSAALSVCLTVRVQNIQDIFFVAAILQLLAVFWFIFIYNPKQKKKSKPQSETEDQA